MVGKTRTKCLDALDALPLTWRDRWVPSAPATRGDELSAVIGQSIFEAVLPPTAVIREDRLDHNIVTLQRFCDESGVLLAPHAKTTMAPHIWQRQLDAGAWGLTAANAAQARVMKHFGVERVLIANEVVDPVAIEWLGAAGAAGDFEVYCLVDSVQCVEIMDAVLRGLRLPSVDVLIEIGVSGGRTGCRTEAQVHEVACAVRGTSTLNLRGIECYEGLIERPTLDGRLDAVARYLESVRAVACAVIDAGHLDGVDRVIVSGGGSAFFDLVVDELAPCRFDGAAVDLVLRSGCYVVHDCDMYETTSPFGALRGADNPRLLPALEVWACVLSTPETTLMICGAGKRDMSVDYALPQVVGQFADGSVHPPPSHWRTTGLMDHHAFVHVAENTLGVGDWVAFGISHPCTTFDRWSSLPLVGDDYCIRGIVRTLF
jgi:D-serine deaminase-like pyridoxal phosphate-dependent protein